MKLSIFSGLVCVFVSVAHAAWALEGLSLENVRARAEARAASVRIATQEVREAEATRAGAGLWLPTNPTVSFDLRRGFDTSPGRAWGYGANVEALFEVGGAPGARLKEAEARARAARASAEITRLEARTAATRAYVTTVLARSRKDSALQALEIAERLLLAARERLAAGAGNNVELSTAKMEVAEAKRELGAAETEVMLSEMELRFIADLPARGPLALTSNIDAPREAPSVTRLLAAARSRQPDLAEIDARLALFRASDARLRKEALPKVGGYGIFDATPDSPKFAALGVTVELPFPQRNQGPRAVLAARRDTETVRRSALSRRVELEILHRRDAYELARAELSVVLEEAIPAAEQRLTLVEEGFRAGRFDVFRVTAAARDLVRLRSLRLDVLTRIWTQRLALERIAEVFEP